MARTTEIEWTEHTWNPFAGCSIHTAGCTNCYAMRQAYRIEQFGTAPHYAGLTKKVNGNIVWTGRVARGSENIMSKPFKIPGSALIFVNSMSDFWHENAKDEWRMAAIEVMRKTPKHAYQVLTKRPEQAIKFFERHPNFVLPENFWLGVTVEHAKTAQRIDLIRSLPAKTRFISFEPIVGSVGEIDLTGIHWMITGGESGPGHRPMKLEWMRELHQQSREQQVPHFFKQWGHWSNNPLRHTCPSDMREQDWIEQQDPVGKGGSLLDGCSWKEMPSCWPPLENQTDVSNFSPGFADGVPSVQELAL